MWTHKKCSFTKTVDKTSFISNSNTQFSIHFKPKMSLYFNYMVYVYTSMQYIFILAEGLVASRPFNP